MSGPDAAIAEYLAAYEQRHRQPSQYRLAYAKGWVEFRSPSSSWVVFRKRLKELAEMAGRLREGASVRDERAKREDAKRLNP